ncbi:hypothetical protein GCM10009554_71470 [Kribbella koreensis]|uniref:Transposase n=2 Tax=Kribbella TaxID=182639 RepID=A0ABP6YU38_9ACTN
MLVRVPATIPVKATAPAAATQMMVTDFFTDDPPGVGYLFLHPPGAAFPRRLLLAVVVAIRKWLRLPPNTDQASLYAGKSAFFRVRCPRRAEVDIGTLLLGASIALCHRNCAP